MKINPETEELLIWLARGPKRRRGANVPRSPGGPFYSDEILSRRISSRAINFYDLAQINVGGIWKDLPGAFGERETPIISDISGPDFQPVSFSAEDWGDLHQVLFETPIDTWQDHFRRIDLENAAKYSVQYKHEDDTWRYLEQGPFGVDGLPPVNPGLGVRSMCLCLNFDLTDTANYKVTTTYDFDAPDAEINLSSGGDVFLIPHVGSHYADMGYDDGGDPYVAYFAWMFCKWAPISREVLLNKTGNAQEFLGSNDFAEIPVFRGRNYLFNRYASTNPEFTNPNVVNGSYISDAFLEEFRTNFIERFDPIEDNPFLQQTWSDGPSIALEYIASLYPMEGDSRLYRQDHNVTLTNIYEQVYFGEGLLKAIIRASGTTYFVWNRQSNALDSLRNYMRRYAWVWD